nr:reverse transcriptase domain-containing protein [Tanacetum cinerariifolium]
GHKLANRSVAYPAGIAEDVFMQVGKFTFPADVVVVDYDVDPRIPFILGRPFLRTVQALVDVYGKELTLRFDDEKLVFNVESTSKYPHKHGDKSINQIDMIDTTCKDNFHEVLNVQKSIHPLSGSLTSSSNPVVVSLSSSLTPFRDSDFLLEEIDTLLALDDSIPPKINERIFDPEGDILLLENLLNNDSTKDLPPKELTGTSKLLVIIAKDLKREEKDQLIKVLKSHKRAIAWKISDVRGIDHNFCTHKILMEDDFKPTIQHQRRIVLGLVLCMSYQRKVVFSNSYRSLKLIKTTFTYSDGTFAYRRMPFSLRNAHGTFQRCMVEIFYDMIEKTMKFFMDDFLVFGDSCSSCFSNFDMMLKRYEDTNLVLNWEKCRFMVKKGIVLSHKISKNVIEVDRAKVNVIAELPLLLLLKEYKVS